MPVTVEQNEHVTLGHRVNFLSESTGPGTVAWRFRTADYELRRPDDGSPAETWQVRCPTCRKDLGFTVRSVHDTVIRQAAWRTSAWAALALCAVGAGLGFAVSGPASVVGIVVAVVAAFAAYLLGLTAAGERGVSGHGAGWPSGSTKHPVTVVRPEPTWPPARR